MTIGVRSKALHIVFFLTCCCVVALNGVCQDRIESGQYRGFLREKPELNRIEVAPIYVAAVQGRIVLIDNLPVSGAIFEIRDRAGKVLSTTTDAAGTFNLEHVLTGIYFFKVTKNEFHSIVGKIVVSDKVSQKKKIHLQLQVGT